MDVKSSTPLFRLDLSRGFFLGILDSSFGVFVLLICIRHFEAPDYCKGLIAAGGSVGLLATSLLVGMWSNSSCSEPIKCSIYMFLSGLFIFLSSWVSGVMAFTVFMLLAQIFLSQVPSLMIGVYSSLYMKEDRGFRVSCNLVMSTIGGIATSFLFGHFLDEEQSGYRLILWSMSFSAFFCSIIHFFMPSVYRKREKLSLINNLGNVFRLPLEDSLFGRILIAWMILGFGAIMTFPLRVEYLAEEGGLNLSNAEIALIGVGIFFLFKIIGSLFWGKLFDRMHFMRYRITINLFMLVAILVYFNAPGFLGVAIGAALAGVATGGANLAWSLWVTKIAPPGRVSEYMGVHMSFTGIRGASAPFMGYALVEPLGFSGVSFLSAGCILLATILFATTLKDTRFSDSSEGC